MPPAQAWCIMNNYLIVATCVLFVLLDGQSVKRYQMASIGSSLRKSVLIAMLCYYVMIIFLLKKVFSHDLTCENMIFKYIGDRKML